MNNFATPDRDKRRSGGLAALACAALLVSACEAPLDLSQVEAESALSHHRYDMFQAVAHKGSNIVVASSVGAVVQSGDYGATWQRVELPGRPALIDITVCPGGEFFALDTNRQVWRGQGGSRDWTPSAIDTQENTLSIHCAPNGRLWVSASFGTLYWTPMSNSGSDNLGKWNEFSLYEDLQFTAVRFVDRSNGFAVGEFGTVMVSRDGGDSWRQRRPIPNDFYPMGADFLDRTTGWVGGLDGIVWRTTDGGRNWRRQETPTSSPIYGIRASRKGVYAVGGSAKLVEFHRGQWRTFEGGPEVLAYMRGVGVLDNGALLVAGGGGTLAVIADRGAGR